MPLQPIRPLRICLVVACLLTATTSRAQFTLDGRAAAYDSLTTTYLFTLPADSFSRDYHALLTLDSLAGAYLVIDSDTLLSGDSCTFTSLDALTPHTLLTADGDSAGLSFTCLPLLLLSGSFGYDYTAGTATLILPQEEAGTDSDLTDMSAKIKWRGGSTNSSSRHKRNYHIKFLKASGEKKNRRFFNLRNDNDWLLDAAQIDMSRCRNRVVTDLWLDFCTPPHYIDSAPSTLSAARGRFCEVFVNNQYAGIYSLTENVDAKQLDLVDYDDDEDIHHGHLWKTKSYSGATMMTAMVSFDDTLELSNGVEVKYPDIDDVCPTDWSLYSQALDFVVNASDADFSLLVADYFDLPVLVDYYILLQVVMGHDNYAKNIFWACRDEQTSPLLTLAVWDLDATVGQHYDNSDSHYRSETIGPEVDFLDTWCYNRLLWRLSELYWFNDLVDDRYTALRTTHLCTDSLCQRFTDAISLFTLSGAAGREEQRWSGDTDINERTLDLSDELLYITDWLTRRMAYLDNVLAPTAIEAPCAESPGATSSSSDIVYTLSGQALRHGLDAPLPPGIYLHQGRKILIR